MSNNIRFSIETGDIITIEADVVALKYAQDFFGADYAVSLRLDRIGISQEDLRPAIGSHRFTDTRGCIQARYVLFLGVESIRFFDYPQIRTFGADVLSVLAEEAPDIKTLAMTIHGPGYGLDETEAFLAQFSGYIDSIQQGSVSPVLESITIVDINPNRVKRLRAVFEHAFIGSKFVTRASGEWAVNINVSGKPEEFVDTPEAANVLETTGIESGSKPHIFVAMPFKKDMKDVYYYGIKKPVNSSGFLCERIDQEAFVGDILDRVKEKIETSALVIADMSDANPNVYLEIGYAWGIGKPTILLINEGEDPKFDVRGQKYLKYEIIQDLEEMLTQELTGLKDQGII